MSAILKGQITDAHAAAVAGAAVTVSSPDLQGPREAVADANGEYGVVGLPPGTYALSIGRIGFRRFEQSGLLLRAGQTLVVNAQLSIGDINDTVTVSARADTPAIDTENPELHFHVSGEFLRQLPLGSRHQWDQLWQLVPGVITSARTGDGDIEVNVHGASERSNVMKIDGFDIGDAFTNQHWTTQFSTESVQDVAIKTAGLDASTPLGRGGFANIVTKSGGNTVHGSAAIVVQPRQWNGNNVPGGRPPDQSYYHLDGSLGGPILRDRTWYFGSFRRVHVDEGVPRTAAVLQNFKDNGLVVPDYDKTSRHSRFFGKVTQKVGAAATVTATYLDDRGKTYNSESREQSTRESTVNAASGGPMAQATWSVLLGSQLLLQGQYGYRRIHADLEPVAGKTMPALVRYGRTVLSAGLPVGQDPLLFDGSRAGLAAWSNSARDHHEITSDATYRMRGPWGAQTLKVGLQHKPRSRFVSEAISPASGLALIEEVRVEGAEGSISFVPFHRQTQTPARLLAFDITYSLFGIYVQDQWQPTDRLTVTMGARYDRQRTSDTFDLWGIDTASFNPRFGAALRVSETGRDVVRVSWGLVNDLLYTQVAPNAGGTEVGRLDEYDLNLDGAFETVLTSPAVLTRSSPPNDRGLDPGTSTPTSREVHIGYTRQLPGRALLDVAYVNRVFKNEIGTYDTNVVYQNGRFVGYANPEFNAMPMITNRANAKRKYHAVEVSAIRNIGARWSAFANYTYQKMTESGEWGADRPERYLHPADWFEHDKLVRPHIVRLSASYLAAWGIQSSVIYSLTSGIYSFTPITTTLDAPDPALGPASVLLSNGRVVSNPLATTTRFIGRRGDTTLQGPTVHRLNTRLGKAFALKGGRSFTLNLDVFNITNSGAPLSFRSTNMTSPLFGQFASTTQSPRAGQVSAVYRF